LYLTENMIGAQVFPPYKLVLQIEHDPVTM
jgi:hypothetical protein